MNHPALDTLVAHPGGALGDFVLTWPLLRTLAACGAKVGIVSAASRVSLAARWLGVTPLPDHIGGWSSLWSGEAGDAAPWARIDRVIAFGHRSGAWCEGLRRRCPDAMLRVEERTLDRGVALEIASEFGVVVPSGPRRVGEVIVLHAGAGSVAKQWGLGNWTDLAAWLRASGRAASLVAGDEERERWGREICRIFEDAGGRWLDTPNDLSDVIEVSGWFVSADTGPGHLAAQAGLGTLTLFGPTDATRWRPIGPDARVVVGADGTMSSIDPRVVWEAIIAMEASGS
jgi:hypothetical protein